MNTTSLPDRTPHASDQKLSAGRFLPHIARFLFGIPLVIFGLNGFFNFIPQPTTSLPADALTFVTALATSGYMLQLIGTTHLVVGLLLITNRFVPLALVLVAPFLVNSLAFHFFLEPSGRPPAVVFTLLELYLVWCYRDAFRTVLTARTAPSA